MLMLLMILESIKIMEISFDRLIKFNFSRWWEKWTNKERKKTLDWNLPNNGVEAVVSDELVVLDTAATAAAIFASRLCSGWDC